MKFEFGEEVEIAIGREYRGIFQRESEREIPAILKVVSWVGNSTEYFDCSISEIGGLAIGARLRGRQHGQHATIFQFTM